MDITGLTLRNVSSSYLYAKTKYNRTKSLASGLYRQIASMLQLLRDAALDIFSDVERGLALPNGGLFRKETDFLDIDAMAHRLLDPAIDKTALNQEDDISNEYSAKQKARWIIQAAEATHAPMLSGESESLSPLSRLGMALAYRRKQIGFSINTLSQKTSLDAGVIFSIELGLAPLNIVSKNLRVLCKALRIDYSILSKLLADEILKS